MINDKCKYKWNGYVPIFKTKQNNTKNDTTPIDRPTDLFFKKENETTKEKQ